METETFECYTFTETDSPFYTLPPLCNDILSVKTLTYDDTYEDVDFIKITKGDKLIGFSLHILFDERVKEGLKLIYK